MSYNDNTIRIKSVFAVSRNTPNPHNRKKIITSHINRKPFFSQNTNI